MAGAVDAFSEQLHRLSCAGSRSKDDKYVARRALIKEIFDAAYGRYGHRRVRLAPAGVHCIQMSVKTVL